MTKPTTSSVTCPAVTPRTSSELLEMRLPDDVQERLRAQAEHGAALLGVVPDGTECVGVAGQLPLLAGAGHIQRRASVDEATVAAGR
ncbi:MULTISPECIES: hypothetical protein [Streptomyces]|uniref:CBS domain-containing protein n=1 Tax=Streptomyces canarius TaxID=285453 RepID=A0ABQ3D0D0_9ACTN|nr:hypothetical protein [Streptomyces canarius]GHA51754.1 hypothetical protein GCM10010345_65420 [Streptomyces canarius]